MFCLVTVSPDWVFRVCQLRELWPTGFVGASNIGIDVAGGAAQWALPLERVRQSRRSVRIRKTKATAAGIAITVSRRSTGQFTVVRPTVVISLHKSRFRYLIVICTRSQAPIIPHRVPIAAHKCTLTFCVTTPPNSLQFCIVLSSTAIRTYPQTNRIVLAIISD